MAGRLWSLGCRISWGKVGGGEGGMDHIDNHARLYTIQCTYRKTLFSQTDNLTHNSVVNTDSHTIHGQVWSKGVYSSYRGPTFVQRKG